MGFHQDVVRLLEEIGQMMELLGEDSFRAGAHARAAREIRELAYDLESVAGERAKLLSIPGVGPKIADKIGEFRSTGKIGEHERLRGLVPATLLDVLRIPGLGPKTVAVMWREGGIVDRASLARAIESGALEKLPRLGAKSAAKIKQALEFAATGTERLALGMAMPLAEAIVGRLRAVPGAGEVAFAGSLRRGRDTVGDIDILAGAKDGRAIMEAFWGMPGVERVIAAGDTKSSVRLARGGGGVQADLRVVPASSYGAAMLYFTGSKEHNVALRERAQKRGMTLNEYGLFPEDGGATPPQTRGVRAVASRTEGEIYAALGMPFVPPEVREGGDELSLKETPALIETGDIRAELHAHTTASDGAMPIAELARAAKDRGFHTIAVTDHSKSQPIAGGLSVDRLREHVRAIRAARKEVEGISILAGSEVDILADGRLDYDDEVLAELDIVVASPHGALSQDSATATERLVRAVSHPAVRVLGHATGRLINQRPGLSPDMGAVIAAARANGVALEINAHWHRLDLRDVHARAAMDAGCLIAINCDVHTRDDFDNLRYGVLTARRGWVTAAACVNTWSARALREWLKGRPAR